MTIEPLLRARQNVRLCNPLIHCITNPISMNDCANAVLAVGARPIMAEHPQEVAAITRSAAALLVNLGNITDARLESMQISGEEAKGRGIPCVIDLVGVGCSLLRLQFARKFVGMFRPAIIKGNLSELKAFAGTPTRVSGVDVSADDCLTPENTAEVLDQLTRLSRRTGAVIFATGAVDLAVDGGRCILLRNGDPLLARLTGTGCIAGVLAAVYVSCCGGLAASALAASVLGIAGELAAERAAGIGSFRAALLDALGALDDESLANRLRWEH